MALYVGEGSKRQQWHLPGSLLWLSVTSSTTHKQIGPSWCWVIGGWVCVHSRTLWVSPTNSPLRLGVSPTAATPTGSFIERFEALFPSSVTLGYAVCLTPHLFLPLYLHTIVGPPNPQATILLWVLSAPATLPTTLDECFFFNSLVVRLPYNLIFWQFRLFFVFKFVVVLLLVVRGCTVYLSMPPSWSEFLALIIYDVFLYALVNLVFSYFL